MTGSACFAPIRCSGATGRTLTEWQALTTPTLAPGSWTGIAVEPPRDQLYARIDARARTMLQEGALQEAMRLATRRLDPELPAMKAVGLQAFIAAAEGRIGSAQALERVSQDSRRYAKRQLTWLRKPDSRMGEDRGRWIPGRRWRPCSRLLESRRKLGLSVDSEGTTQCAF